MTTRSTVPPPAAGTPRPSAAYGVHSGTAGEAVVVALNVAGAPVELPAADATAVACGNGRLDAGRVHLPARGWAVLTA